MHNLGKKGKDKITGFTGIIIGKINYLTGCNQYGLTPAVDKDGKTSPSEWFDESRIEIIGEGINAKEVTGDEPGGFNRDAPRG